MGDEADFATMAEGDVDDFFNLGYYNWIFSMNEDGEYVFDSSDITETDYNYYITYKDGIVEKLRMDNGYMTFEFTYRHPHSFTYSASDNTITATCSNDDNKCDLDDGTGAHKVSLTLTATSPTYSGSGVEPTITYGTTDEQATWTNADVQLPESTGTGTPTVKKFYYNADSSGQKVGDALDSTPVNAGKYVVEVNITYGTGDEAGQKASVALPYEIKKADAPAAPFGLTAKAPQYIGGNDGKITGVDTTMEYSTDGILWRSVTGTEITGLSTGTVYVRKPETANVLAGTPTTVTVPAGTEKNPAPAAPTGLTVVPASALDASDGKITGVDPSTMEYSLDNGNTWSNVPGTEITGLEAGKNVQVRLKATDTHLASKSF